MALHTGVAEVRDNDYFGLPLNRVARLLSTGYGGQILLSLATQQLVRDHLPPNTDLKGPGRGWPEGPGQIGAHLPDCGFPISLPISRLSSRWIPAISSLSEDREHGFAGAQPL